MMDTFKNHLHLPVTKVDDSERVLGSLKVSPKLHSKSWLGNRMCYLEAKQNGKDLSCAPSMMYLSQATVLTGQEASAHADT